MPDFLNRIWVGLCRGSAAFPYNRQQGGDLLGVGFWGSGINACSACFSGKHRLVERAHEQLLRSDLSGDLFVDFCLSRLVLGVVKGGDCSHGTSSVFHAHNQLEPGRFAVR